jgi:hypothetical protein
MMDLKKESILHFMFMELILDMFFAHPIQIVQMEYVRMVTVYVIMDILDHYVKPMT